MAFVLIIYGELVGYLFFLGNRNATCIHEAVET